MGETSLGTLVKQAKGEDRSLREYAKDSGVDAAIARRASRSCRAASSIPPSASTASMKLCLMLQHTGRRRRFHHHTAASQRRVAPAAHRPMARGCAARVS